MTAQAARIFRPYDPAFASVAGRPPEKSYQFLQAHPEYHQADQAGFRTGAYEINEPNHRQNGVPENRLWAAAELWETTGVQPMRCRPGKPHQNHYTARWTPISTGTKPRTWDCSPICFPSAPAATRPW